MRLKILIVLDFALFGQALSIFSSDTLFSSLWILSYQQAIILGVLETFGAMALTVLLLWKTVVWWHDRPRSPKHVFDDPNLLD
jgi:hypothetical protein